MSETQDQLHARLLEEAKQAGATVEDFARAWASIDGKRNEFDAGKGSADIEAAGGHYAGYLCEAEEIFRRAAKYAAERLIAPLLD